ncbi:DUF4333 domain-containing protein [Micromonospora sp. NPDC050397]|uniref:DUF4333 domain-containing protein n=1 Tax=Micromonospora sp. NPDC050397 TaxID=3364279 RepID=UPI00384ADD17
MTSPYGPFHDNDPQRWGQPLGSPPAGPEDGPRPAPRWSAASPLHWGPAPAPQWGPASTEQSGPGQQDGEPGRRRPATGRRARLALTVGGPVLALAALVVVLGLTWPGFLNQKVFDGPALQVGVADVLRNSYQVDVTGVSCPAGQPVRAEARFPCAVLVGGEQKTVTIVVSSDDGRFEVGRPQ